MSLGTGLPLDTTGVAPDGTKVTFKKWRSLNIALRNNPACFKITGEDTEEWRDAIAVFRQAWTLFHANAREDNFVGTHTITSTHADRVEVMSVSLAEVVLMTETPAA